MTHVVQTIEGYPPTKAGLVLGVSRIRVDQLIRAGQLDVIVTPLGRIITAESLERLRKERADAAEAVAS